MALGQVPRRSGALKHEESKDSKASSEAYTLESHRHNEGFLSTLLVIRVENLKL